MKFLIFSLLLAGQLFGQTINGSNANIQVTQPGTGAVKRTVADKLAEVYSVKDYGAKGDGSTDDTTAIQAALDAANSVGVTAYFPAGVYEVSATLEVMCSVRMDDTATIQASTSMDAVINVGSSGYVNDGSFIGGIIDANSNANDGLFVRQYRHFLMRDIKVLNAQNYGFHLGDPSFMNTSFEAIGSLLHTERTGGMIQTASAGVYIESNSTDNNISASIFVSSDYGIETSTGGNFFSDVHVWAHPSYGSMSIGFYDKGAGNFWKGCEADTVTTYGMELTSVNASVIGCRFYNNSISGSDNVVIAIHTTVTDPSVAIMGNNIIADTSSVRFAKDLDISNYAHSTVTANTCQNVVVTQSCVSYRIGTGYSVQLGGFSREGSWTNTYFALPAVAPLQWAGASQDTTNGTKDTGLSRCSAGLICAGNATQGDYSAQVKSAGYLSTAASCTGLSTVLVDDGTCRPLNMFISGNSAGNSIGASTTSYIPFGVSSPSTTQSLRYFIIPNAGTLRNFYVTTTSTQNAGGTMVCSITQNGTSASAITVTFGAGDGSETKSDTTHTLNVSAGDILSMQCVNNYSGGSSAIIGTWTIGLY